MASSAVMAIVAAAVLATVAADSGLVDAPAGPIQGVVTPWAREFRGVPFAKSPVGSLRWALPQRAAPWTQTLDASQDGPGCPQQCVLPKRGCPPTTSEDCLLLNIFTPLPDSDIAVEDAQDGGSPVMVFIHGGNMRQGYAGGPLYDGTHLANTTGVVVVVIQYRLGMLGWLTTNTTMPPNLGLRDQLMALAWVQDNIAAFGGDPSKVTVFGQSAGAVSIAALLGAPASKGLFRAAIMESEPFGIPYRTTVQSQEWTYDVGTRYAGCPSGQPVDDCLRKLSTNDIIKAQVAAMTDILDNAKDLLELFWPWGITVGDELVPRQPMDSWRDNDILDVPFMIGTVHDEGTPFVYEAVGKPASRLEYDVLLGVLFGIGNAVNIGFAYPVPKNETDARPTMARAATDGLFACETRNATLAVAASSSTTTKKYIYHFNKVLSFNKYVWGANYTECWDKVCHAGELPEVFHPNASIVGTKYLPDEEVLSAAMETWWSNFARTGAPGSAVPYAGAAPLEWPAFTPETKMTMDLNTPCSVVADPKGAACVVWDNTGYDWLQR